MFIQKLTITLENIKGIKTLVFDVPTKSGVYVLTGINGCGKSTLMTAMARISDTSVLSSQLIDTPFDSYRNAKISYHIEKDGNITDVYFTKNKSNWTPHPKSISIGKVTPFTNVIYITTSIQRFFESTIKKNPIEKTEANARSASVTIKTGLKKILDNDKFDKLRYQTIKNKGAATIRPRRGNKVYYLPLEDGTAFSELNFSLGERMVLNALESLENVKEKSLLLIDEIELALHPTAQIRFYDYIKAIAKEKKLMVIISTHSPSLIRYASNRYFLELDEKGNVEVKTNCLPSYILRDITTESENNPDYLLFVEDEQAKRLLEVIISSLRKRENCNKYFTYRVVRVGGWEETIRLMNAFKAIKPYNENTVEAFPDLDAQDAINDILRKKEVDRTDADKRRLELWNSCKNNILPLHITPELGVWQWLLTRDTAGRLQESLEKEFDILAFKIKELVYEVEEQPNNGKNERETAKYKLMDLVNAISSRLPEVRKERIYDIIYDSYVENNYTKIREYYKKTLCMILGRK